MSRSLTFEEAMQQLHALGNPDNVTGQQRFGIKGTNMLGTSIYDLRKFSRGVCNHELAAQLWQTGIHDARLLATLVDDPKQVTREQMNHWVDDFDSWDICDQATDNLFIYADGILELIPEWAENEAEYVRRAAFAAMAAIAWHGKHFSDEQVAVFFPLIEQYATDERNFVKKAVNWALRNIGKRRPELRSEAVNCAQRLLTRESRSARWIARDALKEFERKFGLQK